MRWFAMLAPTAMCACTSSASLAAFPGAELQLYQGDLETASGVVCDVSLAAPPDCPELTRAVVLVNGQRPPTSSWGATLDQGECQPPSFELTLPVGDDAELVMTGDGHVDDMVVSHALAQRRFIEPALPSSVTPGGSLDVGWSGAPGDAPMFTASLATSSTTAAVTLAADPAGTGLTIGIPPNVAPGAYQLELFASLSPTVSVCNGLTGCSALIVVDAKLPLTVAPSM